MKEMAPITNKLVILLHLILMSFSIFSLNTQLLCEKWDFVIRRNLCRESFHYPILDSLDISVAQIKNDTLSVSMEKKSILQLKSDSILVFDMAARKITRFTKEKFTYPIIGRGEDIGTFSFIKISYNEHIYVFRRKRTLNTFVFTNYYKIHLSEI